MKPTELQEGALVYQEIEALVKHKQLFAAPHLIQPASVDLTLGEWIVQIDAVPPLGINGFDADVFIDAFAHKYIGNTPDKRSLLDGAVTLMPGAVYLAELQEHTNLPAGVTGYCNPKSSTGRTDIFVQVIAEGEKSFNTVSAGKKRLFLVIQTNSFQVRVSHGLALSQLRFFQGDRQYLRVTDYKRETGATPLVINGKPEFSEDGLTLHLNLHAQNLVALNYKKPVDLGLREAELGSYFQPRQLTQVGDEPVLILEPGQFLLACTIEDVFIPPHCSATMESYAEEHGAFFSHFAGFFDPGFQGSVVCEIRNVMTGPIALIHGQRVGFLKYEYNTGVPSHLYEATGNYFGQTGARHAKFFQ